MPMRAKILALFLLVINLGLNDVHAQVFIDSTLNFSNPNDLILKVNSGTKGIAIADYNQDGYLDIYFVVKEQSSGGDASSWNRLFSFDGTSYSDKTSIAGNAAKGLTTLTQSQYDYKFGASWGDYNNDGYPDLFLSNSGHDLLLKNNGDGSFSNITNIAGVAGSVTQLSSQGLWFDYDKDGDLDLYVSVQMDQNQDSDNKANRMYENLGDDEFENVSLSSGLNDSGFTWTSVALDVNKDGHLDVYVANDFGPNKFYINNGDKTFTEKTAEYGLEDGANGMGLAIGDPNLDGLFDFYLTNITELDDHPDNNNRLFINSGDSSFTKTEFLARVSKAGWGWGTDFFDFDNDGDEDLLVANGYGFEAGKQINRLFQNKMIENDTLLFSDVSGNSGFTEETESFTNAVFDQNNDGYLDIITSNTFKKPLFFQNSGGDKNWIKILLEGVETNRNGFGSIVTLEINGNTFSRYYHGSGLFTQNILPIHFGLDEYDLIDKISVNWLNGQVDEVFDVPVNQIIKLREFDGLVATTIENTSQISPNQIRLIGNYPNPFNPETIILFELQSRSQITIEIFNTIGQLIHTESKVFEQGLNKYKWNSVTLNSGMYFYKISDTKGSAKTGKMLFLK